MEYRSKSKNEDNKGVLQNKSVNVLYNVCALSSCATFCMAKVNPFKPPKYSLNSSLLTKFEKNEDTEKSDTANLTNEPAIIAIGRDMKENDKIVFL